MAVLIPSLSTNAPNFGMAESYSYIPVDNDQGRHLYAKLTYLVNPAPVVVQLSAGSLALGAIEIKDAITNKTVDIVSNGSTNAMRVLTQDFDHSLDSVAIGDQFTLATVNAATSSLNVNVTSYIDHGSNSVSIGDPFTLATVHAGTSALNVRTVNSVSAVSITNQLTAVTVTNPITAVALTNPQVPGFNIPTYTEVDMTYFGSTNNYNTVIYKSGVTTVASLSFVYVGGVPSANDALMSSIIRTA